MGVLALCGAGLQDNIGPAVMSCRGIRVSRPLLTQIGDHGLSRSVIVVALGLAACHHVGVKPTPSPAPPAYRVEGPFTPTVRAGDVATFRAAVPAMDTGGHCESVPGGPMLQPGQRALLFAFGPRGARYRNVMLIVDSAGRPVRYSDVRGDLRGPNDSSISDAKPLGPRTSVALNLLDQTGMLSNTGTGAELPVLRVRGPSILDAENLGIPSLMIKRILKECAGRSG
jgi:hypothetical protein